MTKHTLLIITLLLTLTACNKSENITPSSDTNVSTPTSSMTLSALANSLKSKKACLEHNGKWQKVGMLQMPACVLKAKDAGKPCTDSSQCEISCIATERVPEGEKVVGSCVESTNVFGCRTFVRDGRAEPTLCID